VSLADAHQRRGPWGAEETTAFLDATIIPVKLAATAPSGWPLLVSLWFLRRDGMLLCATQQDAHITRALRRDPRCAFEVSPEQPPYCGVRGRAKVTITTDGAPALLGELCERYLGATDSDLARWLLSRAENEVLLVLDPHEITTWDYRRRMGGAGA
jgi:hypothetical protein